MEQEEEIRRLLQEIRDAQREHLAEYRRVAERSLEIQERAVARQEQAGRPLVAVPLRFLRRAGSPEQHSEWRCASVLPSVL